MISNLFNNLFSIFLLLLFKKKGDNLIIGSYDKRLCWFDLDLSVKPYKTLRYHKYAIRNVCYHRKYPLFASCSDDGNINIFHGMVYNDLLQNPLIVPVKIIKAHEVTENLGMFFFFFFFFFFRTKDKIYIYITMNIKIIFL